MLFVNYSMSIDHIIRRFETQGLDKYSWEIDST